ncbi:hypothetical protein glysoja_048382 [Glycine soja]|uniref:Uncharacterized protein n=1 Tax=Glycine soja TaxID=3848 RepID=A0A0B2STN1_GLYSO|nr:hypothetical protein glysoja_048382 [Glycine soja]
MVFCNKVGNVLRQSVARSTKAPVSCMLNYIRCMSSSKLFIGVVDTNHTPSRQFSYGFIVLDFAILGLSYGVDD